MVDNVIIPSQEVGGTLIGGWACANGWRGFREMVPNTGF